MEGVHVWGRANTSCVTYCHFNPHFFIVLSLAFLSQVTSYICKTLPDGSIGR